MTGIDSSGEASGRGRNRTVQRAIIALIVTALVVFALVATGAVLIARHVARGEALDESIRTASVVAQVEFVPEIPAVIAGDPAAIAHLDEAVAHRRRDGAILRVKVWRANGTVVYSDDHQAIGQRYPLDSAVKAAISKQSSTASISSLNDPENVTELGISDRLVEVYIPLNLDDGTHLAFELYSSTSRVSAAEKRMTDLLVPFALAASFILLIAQLPLSLWLIRRVGRAQEERRKLLFSSLTASDRERRTIAGDLHDGVVQDLAGASYVLGALSRTLPEDTTTNARKMLHTAGSVLKSSIASLRTLMVDIYPPDLTGDGLPQAIDDLATKFHAHSGAEVSTDISLQVQLSTAVAASVFRCARESLENVRKHAGASHVNLFLLADEDGLRLRIVDDGVGLAPQVRDREGHLGLHLMQDAARDLGGHLHVSSPPGQGTTVELQIPARSLNAGGGEEFDGALQPMRL